MSCSVIQDSELGTVIACSRGRGRRRHCFSCGNVAKYLCDAPLERVRYPRKSRSRTCDRPLCDACRIEVAPGLDLCQSHRSLEQAVRGQLSLFGD